MLKNTSRSGFVLCNRSATIVYLGSSDAIAAGSGTSIRLLQNEILTILEEEGDDPTNFLYGVASAASVVEMIESVRI